MSQSKQREAAELRTYKKWCNLQLRKFQLGTNDPSSTTSNNNRFIIKNLETDFSTGVLLFYLAIVLTKPTDIPQCLRGLKVDAKNSLFCIMNIEMALKLFKENNCILHNVVADTIHKANNTTSIRGLIWQLMLHYQVTAVLNAERKNNNNNNTQQDVNNNGPQITHIGTPGRGRSGFGGNNNGITSLTEAKIDMTAFVRSELSDVSPEEHQTFIQLLGTNAITTNLADFNTIDRAENLADGIVLSLLTLSLVSKDKRVEVQQNILTQYQQNYTNPIIMFNDVSPDEQEHDEEEITEMLDVMLNNEDIKKMVCLNSAAMTVANDIAQIPVLIHPYDLVCYYDSKQAVVQLSYFRQEQETKGMLKDLTLFRPEPVAFNLTLSTPRPTSRAPSARRSIGSSNVGSRHVSPHHPRTPIVPTTTTTTTQQPITPVQSPPVVGLMQTTVTTPAKPPTIQFVVPPPPSTTTTPVIMNNDNTNKEDTTQKPLIQEPVPFDLTLDVSIDNVIVPEEESNINQNITKQTTSQQQPIIAPTITSQYLLLLNQIDQLNYIDNNNNNINNNTTCTTNNNSIFNELLFLNQENNNIEFLLSTHHNNNNTEIPSDVTCQTSGVVNSLQYYDLNSINADLKNLQRLTSFDISIIPNTHNVDNKQHIDDMSSLDQDNIISVYNFDFGKIILSHQQILQEKEHKTTDDQISNTLYEQITIIKEHIALYNSYISRKLPERKDIQHYLQSNDKESETLNKSLSLNIKDSSKLEQPIILSHEEVITCFVPILKHADSILHLQQQQHAAQLDQKETNNNIVMPQQQLNCIDLIRGGGCDILDRNAYDELHNSDKYDQNLNLYQTQQIYHYYQQYTRLFEHYKRLNTLLHFVYYTAIRLSILKHTIELSKSQNDNINDLEKQLNTLTIQCNELQNTSHNDSERLTNDIIKLKNQIDDFEKERIQNVELINVLKNETLKYTKQIEDLEQQIDINNTLINDFRNDTGKLQKDIEQKEQDILILNNEKMNLSHKLNTSHQEHDLKILEITKHHDVVVNQFEEQLAARSVEINNLQNELNNTKNQIEELQSKIELDKQMIVNLQNNNSTLQHGLDQKEQANDENVKLLLQQNEQVIQQLKDEITTLQQQSNKLHDDYKEKSVAYDTVLGQLEEQKQKENETQDIIKSKENQIITFQSSLNEIQKENTNMISSLKTNDDLITNLESTLKMKSDLINAKDDEIKDLINQFQQSNNQINALSLQLQDVTKDNNNHAVEYAELLANEKAQYDVLTQKYEATKDELQSLQKQHESKIQDKEHQVEQLTSTIHQLESQIAVVQQQCVDKDVEVEKLTKQLNKQDQEIIQLQQDLVDNKHHEDDTIKLLRDEVTKLQTLLEDQKNEYEKNDETKNNTIKQHQDKINTLYEQYQQLQQELDNKQQLYDTSLADNNKKQQEQLIILQEENNNLIQDKANLTNSFDILTSKEQEYLQQIKELKDKNVELQQNHINALEHNKNENAEKQQQQHQEYNTKVKELQNTIDMVQHELQIIKKQQEKERQEWKNKEKEYLNNNNTAALFDEVLSDINQDSHDHTTPDVGNNTINSNEQQNEPAKSSTTKTEQPDKQTPSSFSPSSWDWGRILLHLALAAMVVGYVKR